jgi:hypothetical protein
MEPNVRVQTNRQGFCPAHFRMLYDGENKLGLGLVVHTHLQQILPEIGALLDGLVRAAEGRRLKDRVGAAAARLESLRHSCFICGLLREDTERYVFTILYLWSRDPGFSAVFRASSGFCIPHFVTVLDRASKSMRADRFRRWLTEAIPLMKGSLAGVEKDLCAFTQLHQADNAGLGTDAVRSALARTLQKIAGGIYGDR